MNLEEYKRRMIERMATISSKSRNFFVEMYLESRPENDEIQETPTIKFLRAQNEILQEIHAKATKSESFMHSLANIFKFGAGEAEKTYPSKKK